MKFPHGKVVALAVLVIGASSVILLTGCGSDTGTNPATGSISGTVFKADSPHPVNGVFITCAGKSATTDINGAYQLSGLPLGTQTLSATKEDYEYFTESVTITGDETHDIFITRSKGSGDDIGEG